MKRSILLLLTITLISCGNDDGGGTEEPVIVTNNDFIVSSLTGNFKGSGGMTVADDGFIYVADFGDNLSPANGTQVSKIDPQTGAVSVFATGLNGPSGNDFDSQGNLIQANIQGSTISKISPDGTVTTLTSDQIRGPVGVVVDEQDNAYVCNCGANTIVKVDPQGRVTQISTPNGLYNCPNGITRDTNGNLYIANFNDGRIIKITAEGEESVLATVPGGNNGHIIFGNNRLYVAARRGNGVYEVSLTGEAEHFAGTGAQGNDDGPTNEATFYIPNGIALSPDGKKLYVVSRLVGVGTPLNPVKVRVIDITD